LLFVEASDGNLQAYLDRHDDSTDLAIHMKWRTQAAEATRYTHRKGAMHSDLRPENYLLHTDANGTLNLQLSDFGGSTWGDIDSRHLPDSGFFDPRKPWMSTEATDIFSLGSVFYTIVTGHWPYKSPGPFISVEEEARYDERVHGLLSQDIFPTVEDLAGGASIQGCWDGHYTEAQTIVRDQVILFKQLELQAASPRSSKLQSYASLQTQNFRSNFHSCGS
jgi:serine/threonine protein kinase